MSNLKLLSIADFCVGHPSALLRFAEAIGESIAESIAERIAESIADHFSLWFK